VELPLIDISGWDGGDGHQRRGIAAAVDDACRSIGFLEIVGHGVPPDAVAQLAAAIDWFFGLPAAEKAQWRPPRPSVNRGYTPPRSEKLSYSLGVVSPEDLFEAFNVGAARSDFPALDLDPEVYAENIWPTVSGAGAFRSGVERWTQHAATVARRMTAILALALALPEGHFGPFTDHSIDVLRLNHYHVPDDVAIGPGQLGMGAHTDYGIVTVLWADPVPGLEVLRPDGTWSAVTPRPDALLINLGDLLARWTNDRWLSTLHRVTPPRDGNSNLIRRRSAAFFHDGNADAVISTVASCRAPDGSSAYDDIVVLDHVARKLAGSRELQLNSNDRHAARMTTSYGA
jgi:isopenicillin N synthase-like dioxygenase